MSAKINFLALQRDILKSIRGTISQRKFSQYLGYSENQFYRWEAGKNKISWKEFVTICRKAECGIDDTLRSVFCFEGDYQNFSLFLKVLYPKLSQNVLAKNLKLTRARVNRWLQGVTSPLLIEALSIFQMQGDLELFLFRQFGKSELPSIKNIISNHREQQTLLAQEPLALLIEVCLTLHEYQKLPKHREGWIAQKLGITHAKEIEIVERLHRSGFIEWIGNRFAPTGVSINTNVSMKVIKNQLSFWFHQCAHFVQLQKTAPQSSFFAYKVFPISKKGVREIKELSRKYYSEVNEIIEREEHKPETGVVLAIAVNDIQETCSIVG